MTVKDNSCHHGYSHWSQYEICNAGGFACAPIATLPPWLLSATSESGDKYALRLGKKPSIREIEEMFQRHCPDEFTTENNGPGDFGSCLHIELTKDD